MKPIFFEIEEGTEQIVRLYIKEQKHSVAPRGELKKTPEGVYQLWSVGIDEKEIFWYGIATDLKGRRILMCTLTDKKKQPFYSSFLSKVKSAGGKETTDS